MRTLITICLFWITFHPLISKSISRVSQSKENRSIFRDNHIANVVEEHGNCVVNIVSRVNLRAYPSRRRSFNKIGRAHV